MHVHASTKNYNYQYVVLFIFIQIIAAISFSKHMMELVYVKITMCTELLFKVHKSQLAFIFEAKFKHFTVLHQDFPQSLTGLWGNFPVNRVLD